MQTLTAEHQSTLVEIINEQFGSSLEFDDFCDVLLGLFEDIPGLETISQSQANRLVKLIWRNYHGQDTQKI